MSRRHFKGIKVHQRAQVDIYLKSLYTFTYSLSETFCCCFGYRSPQTPYEVMHRQEMERRRIIAKYQKYQRHQYQKALQEKHRLSQKIASTHAAALKNSNNSSSSQTKNEQNS